MRSARGFTLVEIMVALVVSSIIAAAVFAVFRLQSTTYNQQSAVLEIQQNLRAASRVLARMFREACFDGSKLDRDYLKDEDRLDERWPSTAKKLPTITTADDENFIYRTYSSAQSSAIQVAFEYDASAGQLNMSTDGPTSSAGALIDNVAELRFCYLMKDGTYTTSPATLKNIRGVEFGIVAETGDYEDFVDVDAAGNSRVYQIAPHCNLTWTAPAGSKTRKRSITRHVLFRNYCSN